MSEWQTVLFTALTVQILIFAYLFRISARLKKAERENAGTKK